MQINIRTLPEGGASVSTSAPDVIVVVDGNHQGTINLYLQRPPSQNTGVSLVPQVVRSVVVGILMKVLAMLHL